VQYNLVSCSLFYHYLLIISTSAGLWAYNIGDTVKFTSLKPYRIIVTGRIKQFLSAFGEHVIAEEVEKALKQTLNNTNIIVKEFTVAPKINPKEFNFISIIKKNLKNVEISDVSLFNDDNFLKSLTNEIYNYSKNLQEYKIIKSQSNNSYSLGKYKLASMIVEVVDGIEDYLDLMKKIFDFDLISSYINKDFPIVFDALNAVTGPYAKRLFVDHLGANSETVRNGIPLEDFGGLHPDPNLTYAKDLADLLLKGNLFSFGAACDGDGDRNMILGRGCFVNPSDSLAILAANYDCVPGYAKGLSGVARSMPTSSAVDVVAKHLGINCFETPTGWKFFGNLLDANQITLCGEESFGTGSDHVREKDGLWAVLFWLQILASKKQSVSEIMRNHWLFFGRHYYSRHDYESIPSEVASSLYSRLSNMLPTLKDQSFAGRIVKNADDFSYTDPVDGSITLNQGLRILLDDGSRVLVRLSGTGTQGATLRVYFESFVPSDGDITQDPQLALAPLIKGIDLLAEISKRTGMSSPTVIT